MKIEKLFQVIVAMGASSTVGLAACSSSTSGTGGPSSDDSGATEGTDGSTGATDAATSTTGGDASSCSAVCHADSQVATWTDCNGCCCWLPAGSTSPASTPICGAEPCCTGRGR